MRHFSITILNQRYKSMGKKLASNIISKQTLETEYLVENKSYKEIAKKYGLGETSIGRLIRKYKIPARPRRRPAVRLVGKQYGHLTVLRRSIVKQSRSNSVWECQCDCGNITHVTYSNLHCKSVQSCGCRRRGDKHVWWRGYKEISGSMFKRIHYNAKKRQLEFNITLEYVWKLFEQQNRKCALSGISIQFGPVNSGKITASLDRIDNTKGYIIGNVQWVHKDINWLKQDFEQNYFLELCKNVAKYNKLL